MAMPLGESYIKDSKIYTTGTSIVVWNPKGGSLKTSTIVEIGANLAEQRYKVCLVDLDSNNPGQTDWLLPEQDNITLAPGETSYRLFSMPHLGGRDLVRHVNLDFDAQLFHENRYPSDTLRRVAAERGWQPGVGCLDIIPSHEYLGNLVGNLAGATDSRYPTIADRLRMSLQLLLQIYDFVLIDTPPDRPEKDEALHAALMCADHILIPLAYKPNELKGAVRAMTNGAIYSRDRVEAGLPPLGFLGLLREMREIGSRSSDTLHRIYNNSEFASDMLQAIVPFEKDITAAALASAPVTLFMPTTDMAKAMHQAALEVVDRVNQPPRPFPAFITKSLEGVGAK